MRIGLLYRIFLIGLAVFCLQCERWSGLPGGSEPQQQQLLPPSDTPPQQKKDSLPDTRTPSLRDTLMPLIA